MRPDIPQPSSSTLELASKIPCVNRGLRSEVIHVANKGVIFQTTAPVVPPPLVEESMVGDWWMVKSLSPMVMSRVVAVGETKPRFAEGIGWVNSK